MSLKNTSSESSNDNSSQSEKVMQHNLESRSCNIKSQSQNIRSLPQRSKSPPHNLKMTTQRRRSPSQSPSEMLQNQKLPSCNHRPKLILPNSKIILQDSKFPTQVLKAQKLSLENAKMAQQRNEKSLSLSPKIISEKQISSLPLQSSKIVLPRSRLSQQSSKQILLNQNTVLLNSKVLPRHDSLPSKKAQHRSLSKSPKLTLQNESQMRLPQISRMSQQHRQKLFLHKTQSEDPKLNTESQKLSKIKNQNNLFNTMLPPLSPKIFSQNSINYKKQEKRTENSVLNQSNKLVLASRQSIKNLNTSNSVNPPHFTFKNVKNTSVKNFQNNDNNFFQYDINLADYDEENNNESEYMVVTCFV